VVGIRKQQPDAECATARVDLRRKNLALRDILFQIKAAERLRMAKLSRACATI
jgi:hypothetical protein